MDTKGFMPMTTPTTTRAVIVPRYTDGFAHLTLEDRAIAPLNAGEVLVKSPPRR